MSFPRVNPAFDNSNLMDFSMNKKLISAARGSVRLVTAVTVLEGGTGRDTTDALAVLCLGINKQPEKDAEDQRLMQRDLC